MFFRAFLLLDTNAAADPEAQLGFVNPEDELGFAAGDAESDSSAGVKDDDEEDEAVGFSGTGIVSEEVDDASAALSKEFC